MERLKIQIRKIMREDHGTHLKGLLILPGVQNHKGKVTRSTAAHTAGWPHCKKTGENHCRQRAKTLISLNNVVANIRLS